MTNTESNNPKSKAYIRAHFSQRCHQRVGYVISQEFLLSELQSGNLEFIKDDGDNRIQYRLSRKYGNRGKGFTVIYDKDAELFVTIYHFRQKA